MTQARVFHPAGAAQGHQQPQPRAGALTHHLGGALLRLMLLCAAAAIVALISEVTGVAVATTAPAAAELDADTLTDAAPLTPEEVAARATAAEFQRKRAEAKAALIEQARIEAEKTRKEDEEMFEFLRRRNSQPVELLTSCTPKAISEAVAIARRGCMLALTPAVRVSGSLTPKFLSDCYLSLEDAFASVEEACVGSVGEHAASSTADVGADGHIDSEHDSDIEAAEAAAAKGVRDPRLLQPRVADALDTDAASVAAHVSSDLQEARDMRAELAQAFADMIESAEAAQAAGHELGTEAAGLVATGMFAGAKLVACDPLVKRTEPINFAIADAANPKGSDGMAAPHPVRTLNTFVTGMRPRIYLATTELLGVELTWTGHSGDCLNIDELT